MSNYNSERLGTESSQPTLITIPIVPKESNTTSKNKDSVLDTISTGFGHDNTIYATCQKPTYHQHLCKEQYLGEFQTEEEKQLARHNLGLYDERDIVAMSLLTTEDEITTPSILNDLNIKVLKQGNKAVAVETTANAVRVKKKDTYVTLQSLLDDSEDSVSALNDRINTLISKSTTGSNISTLGDVNQFLKGYKNTDSLQNILGNYLEFESKGTILQKEWQL